MNFIKNNFGKLYISMMMYALPLVSFAQVTLPPPTNPEAGKITNPIPSITSLPTLIQTILIGLIKIGIPIIALALIYSGFLFVAAQGNSEKLETAKKSLLYTIIGAAILLGAWAIAILISETVLGIS